RSRQPANDKTRPKPCEICPDIKSPALFPTTKLTDSRNDHPLPCLSCVANAIAADFKHKIFSPTQIRCPVCTAALSYGAVLKYATREISERYERLTLVKSLQDDQKFVLCHCGAGHIHETDTVQPIVTCLQCQRKSCFVHRTAWHENLTCAEYDALQKDPVGFVSGFERDNGASREAERANRRAPGQQSEEGRKNTNLRARLVNGRRGTHEVPRERDSLGKMRADALKRREAENASATTIDQTTKKCPGCKCRIEKNRGW
ncbi:hypothetical protein V8F06_013832, partial [Rhypophila decipiens]